jgi:hypothetical protein
MRYLVRLSLTMAIVAVCIGCQKKSGNPVSTPQTSDSVFTDAQIDRLDSLMPLVDARIDSLVRVQSAPFTSPGVVTTVLKSIPGVHVLNEGDSTDDAVMISAEEKGPVYAVVWKSVPFPSDTTTPVLDSVALADTSYKLYKRADNQIPPGNQVYLFAALNANGFPNWLPKLVPVFTKAYDNYNTIPEDATVENLRSVSKASVLVYYGHGFTVDNGVLYVMSTASPVDSVLEHSDDRKNRWIWPFNVDVEEKKKATRYCITPTFVAKHWTFDDKSLVILDNCWSGSAKATALHGVLFGLNVSTIVGWSDEVDPAIAEKATCILLDRMLGANCAVPVMDPYQRPFGRDDVLPVLQNLGCAQSGAASIVFDPPTAGASCGILKPSIKKLVPDEPNRQLIIYGIFGDDQSKGGVTIDGADRSIVSWSSTEIKCELKDADAGKVKVKYNGHQSNPVNLTKWDLHLTYTIVGDGSLYLKTDIVCPLRGDVHSFRLKPDEKTLTREEVDLMPTYGDSASWTASGTSKDGYTTWDGSGKGGAPYDAANTTKFAMLWGKLDPSDTTKLSVYADFMLGPGYLVTLTAGNTVQTVTMPVVLSQDIINFNDMYQSTSNRYASGTFHLKKDFSLDGNFNIVGGSVSGTATGQTYTLTWYNTTAQYPPEADWPH